MSEDDIEDVALEEMTDLEIIEEIREIDDRLIQIRGQIEMARGKDPNRVWWVKAHQALQHATADRNMLRAEQRRRKEARTPKLPPEVSQALEAEKARVRIEARQAIVASTQAKAKAKLMAVELQRQRVEQEKARIEAHATRARENAARKRQQTELLYEAAKALLTQEQIRALWAKAREMFPDQIEAEAINPTKAARKAARALAAEASGQAGEATSSQDRPHDDPGTSQGHLLDQDRPRPVHCRLGVDRDPPSPAG